MVLIGAVCQDKKHVFTGMRRDLLDRPVDIFIQEFLPDAVRQKS